MMVMTTGLLMVFEISFGSVRIAHGWMGICFILAAILHVIIWHHSFMACLSTCYLFHVCGAVVSAVILFSLSYSGINAANAAFNLMISLSMDTLASVLYLDVSQLIDTIGKSGVVVEDSQKSLLDVASENSVDIYELIEPLLHAKASK